MPESSTGPPSRGLRGAVTWFTAPAVDASPAAHARAVAFLRILVGAMWLYNVSWKRAPDFGEEADNGLYYFTSYAVEYPVFPPFSWLVENAVLPNFELFGWGVLAAETALAVMLLSGSWVRLAAALGIAQSAAIAMSVAYAPNEWPWAYWLMIGAHVVLLLSVSGRVLAVDGVRARVAPAPGLLQVWGVVAVVAGLFSLFTSFDEPLAARGPGLHSTDLSLSLGYYNLVGALVLLALGALLLLLAVRPGRPLALGTTVLGVLAALSLHAQLGFSDPVLGGSPTSAALLLTLAVVAWSAGPVPSRDDPVSRRART